jgi:DNA-binding PadR family transcriptional regulator
MRMDQQGRQRHWQGHGHGRGFGPRGRGPGSGRMRRGDIRAALLALLAEEPGHGYDLMRRLEDNSGGAWRPSAGSIYPTLQQLEDEGLVTSAHSDGKRVYTLTDAGVAEAERRAEEGGAEPWWVVGEGGVHPGYLFRAIGGLGLAAKQVVKAGTAQQVKRAIDVVDRARRELYGLLAADRSDDVDGAGESEATSSTSSTEA